MGTRLGSKRQTPRCHVWPHFVSLFDSFTEFRAQQISVPSGGDIFMRILPHFKFYFFVRWGHQLEASL